MNIIGFEAIFFFSKIILFIPQELEIITNFINSNPDTK